MKQIAALFPGQGRQKVGMGRELAEAFDEAAQLFERANDALGFDLRRLAWEGPEDELRRTENAQPAILVHSLAVWSVVREELAPRVAAAAGHSLGEFSAYAAAGALSPDDAIRLVRRRGELMAASRQGSMVAIVGLGTENVETVCETVRKQGGVVVPANYNSPQQIVISGEQAAVERAGELARKQGAKLVKPLAVSGAFHSPLMRDAEEGLRAALEEASFRDPEFPVISNVTAEPVGRAADAAELLIKQLTAPVRWTESLLGLANQGIESTVELGPGNVLTGLLKRIGANLSGIAIGGPEDIDKLHEALL